MATDKEIINDLMLDTDNLMRNAEFSNYILFCVGDNKQGGFASVRVKDERGDTLLKAQILDTLKNNPILLEFFKQVMNTL